MHFVPAQPHRILTAITIATMVILGFLMFAGNTHAAPNYQVNYQGKLLNNANVAVADGTYNMRFWLTTSPSAATTSAVWTEELTGSNKVTVTNGLFSVMLGSTTPLTGVDFNQTLYLGVEVGGTGAPAWDGEMSPRKVLGAVPAAFYADQASSSRLFAGIATSSFLRSDEADTASGLLTFTGGFISQASSTIGGGTGATGLTISGGATTTGNAYFGGSVGIGVTSPTSRLSIASPNTMGALQLINSSNSDRTTFSFTTNANHGRMVVYDSSGNNNVEILGSGASFFNGGNLGIGTTTPNELLSVAGNMHLTGALYDRVYSPGSNGMVLQTTASGVEWVATSTLGFIATSSLNTSAQLAAMLTDETGTAGSVVFSGNPLLAGFRSNASSTIGDGTATGGLTISGGATTTGNAYFGGNVGIGSSSPSAKLTVNGSASVVGSELVTNGTFTGNASGWTLGDCATYGANQVTVTYTACTATEVSTDFSTVAGTTYLLTFTLSGVAGDTVTYTLGNNSNSIEYVEVANGTYTFAFTTDFTGTETITFLASNGNDDATWTIDDVSIKATGAIPTALTVVGYDGSTWLTLGGDYLYSNLALGKAALAENTTGLQNTALGGYALSQNVDGYMNTAVGYQALSLNTSGQHNTAQGASALYFNTTGSNNSALGYQALYRNTTGGQNVAIGNNTLLANTTGGQNVAIGISVLSSNTVGSDNTGVGAYALYSNTTGKKNVALGYQAMYTNIEGGENTALGYQALYQHNGTSSVALGHKAGYSLTSGNANTFLGAYADTLTGTISSSTAIGAGAQVGCSNCLVLGGTGANAVNVGIGSTTPSRVLTVAGETYLGATTTIAGNFLPLQDDTYDLGSTSLRFRDLFLGPTTLHIGSSITDEGTISYNTSTNVLEIGTDSTTNGDVSILNGALYVDKSTGFVGIGTTTPNELLSVAGNMHLTGALYDRVYSPGSNGMVLKTTASGVEWVATSTLGLSGASFTDSAGLAGILTDETGTGLAVFSASPTFTGTATFANATVGSTATATDLVATGTIRIVGGTSWPSNPQEGTLFYSTGSTTLYIYEGGKWQQDRTTATVIVAASDSQNKEKADYVATGTNDQDTIESALATLPSHGGLVYLLPGTYSINNEINITQSSTTLMGSGPSTLLKITATSTNWDVIDVASGRSFITIRDLAIDGSAASAGSQNGIAFTTVSSSTIDSIVVQRMRGNGVYTMTSRHNTILGSVVNSNIIGINIQNSPNNSIVRNTASYNSEGIYIYNPVSAGNTVVNNTLIGNTSYGIHLYGLSSGPINTSISGNILRGNNMGISLYTAHNNTLIDNRITDTTFYGIILEASLDNTVSGNTTDANLYGVMLTNGSSRNTVTGNAVDSNRQHGIYIQDSNYNVFSSNILYGNGNAGSYASVYFYNSDDNSIIGNNIQATSTDALIQIDSTTDRTTIANNTYVNADTTTYISDAGTGTRYDDYDRVTLGTPTSRSYSILSVNASSSASMLSLFQQGSGPIAQLYTSTSTRAFTFTNAGYLGLGSSTPNSLLTITNSVGTTAGTPLLTIASTTAGTATTTLFTVLGSGDVEVSKNLISAGVSWTTKTASEANTWYDVTYGNGLFVAVSVDGTNRVMTSPDGVNWTARSAASASTWRSVTYGNGLFVAVGDSVVMTSPDGINWTARTPAAANTWFDVTYGNGLFVAVAWGEGTKVMTSPDGITWTARTAEASGWEDVTYGNGLFVAVGSSGTNRVMTSPDGVNWTARSGTTTNQWMSVTYGNGLFVAVAQDRTHRVMTSSDGTTWTAWNSIPTASWYSVTYGNGLFVATAPGGTSFFATSPDGITWTKRSITPAGGSMSVTYGNGLFVAPRTDYVYISGRVLGPLFAHNNTYQGGMSILGGPFNIGTTTGTTSLSAGNVLNIASTTGTSLLTVTNAGRVGIGTTTPNQLLSVAGNMHLTGALYDRVYSPGSNGMVLQTTGSGVTWVATSTLGFLSTSSLSTSAQLASMLSDETGTAGSVVFSTNPLLAGFRSNASSTVGGGTDTTGLTISGGATTTGRAYFGGNIAVGTTTYAYNPVLSIAGNSAYSSGYNAVVGVKGYQTAANASGYYIGIGAEPVYTAGAGNSLYTLTGEFLNPTNVGGGHISALYGSVATPKNILGTASTTAGYFSLPENASASTIDYMYGFVSEPMHTGSGTTSLMVNYFSDCWNTGTGIVETCIGLFLDYEDTQHSKFTNMYGIFQANPRARNDFFGDVAIGGNGFGINSTPLPHARLAITGRYGSTTPLFDVASTTGIGPLATSSLFRVNYDGKVGVGTLNPASKFHLIGTTGSGVTPNVLTDLTVDDSAGAFLSLLGSNSSLSGILFGTPSHSATSSIQFNNTSLAPGGLIFTTADTPRFTIGRTGNVGIGTTTPLHRLSVVNGTDARSQISFSATSVDSGGYLTSYDENAAFLSGGTLLNESGQIIAKATSAGMFGTDDGNITFSNGTGLTVGNSITLSERMRITAAGNVGIGTTTPLAKLSFASSTSSEGGIAFGPSIRLYQGDTDALYLQGGFISTSLIYSATYLIGPNIAGGFSSGGDLAIDSTLDGTKGDIYLNPSGGLVGIGTTTPVRTLHVVGDIRIGTTGTNGCVERYDGTALTGTCSSDERLKDDVNDLPSVLDEMRSLRVINYRWNEVAAELYKNGTGNLQVGYLAQNVEELFPELVIEDEKGYKRVDYTGLTLYAIKGVTELAEVYASTSPTIEALETASSSILSAGEGDTFWSRLTTLVQGFVDGVLTLAGLRTDELCVGDVCVDEATFLRMVEQVEGTTVPTSGSGGTSGEDIPSDDGSTDTGGVSPSTGETSTTTGGGDTGTDGENSAVNTSPEQPTPPPDPEETPVGGSTSPPEPAPEPEPEPAIIPPPESEPSGGGP